MKKSIFTLLLFSLVFLFSCSEEGVISQQEQEQTSAEFLITKNEAVSVAKILSNLNKTTTNRSFYTTEVKTYVTASKKPIFYTIKKEGSFYVVSADKRLQLVQAYVSNATGELPETLEYFLDRNARAIEGFIDSDFKDLDEYEVQENIEFANNALTQRENFSGLRNITNNAATTTKSRIAKPKLDGNYQEYGPYLTAKDINWGQTSPELTRRWKEKKGMERATLGCMTTAIGQILKYNADKVTEITYNDSERGITNSYTNPFQGENNQETYDQVLADFSDYIRIIFKGAVSYAVLGGFKGRTGENCVNRFVKGMSAKYYGDDVPSEDKLAICINSLKNGNPIIASGNSHAWVLDGYINTRVRKAPGNTPWAHLFDKYGDFFYINWGWDGYYNGWYKMYDFTPDTGREKTYSMIRILEFKDSSTEDVSENEE